MNTWSRLGFLAALLVVTPAARAEDDGSPEEDAIAICEQTIAETLTTAGELQWPGKNEYKVKPRDGGYQVQGYVDRQGTVGLERKPWTCMASPYDGHWRANVQVGDAAAAPPEASHRSHAAEPRAEPRREPDRVAPEIPAPDSGEVAAEPPSRRCRTARLSDVTADRYADRGYQVVRGKIVNFGAVTIRDVRVCASAVCTDASDAPMPNGAFADFTLKVPNLDPLDLGVECSSVER